MLIHPIEQSTILHHILLLYIPGFIPYHNGSNGRIHDPEYVAIYAQPVALAQQPPGKLQRCQTIQYHLENHSEEPRPPPAATLQIVRLDQAY